MAYILHRGAIVLKDGEMYIGVKYPTSNSKLFLIPGKEIIVEEFKDTNFRKLKTMVDRTGKQLSKEDGISYSSNF